MDLSTRWIRHPVSPRLRRVALPIALERIGVAAPGMFGKNLMYWMNKHVLVCTASHCAQKGANDVAGRLRLEMIRKGLDAQILVNNCGTIDLCDIGPNIVVYPDNIIYSGVTVKDIPE